MKSRTIRDTWGKPLHLSSSAKHLRFNADDLTSEVPYYCLDVRQVTEIGRAIAEFLREQAEE